MMPYFSEAIIVAVMEFPADPVHVDDMAPVALHSTVTSQSVPYSVSMLMLAPSPSMPVAAGLLNVPASQLPYSQRHRLF